MTQQLDRLAIAERARVVPAPAFGDKLTYPPRRFGMPTRLYALTIAAYLAFVAVAAVGFPSPGLIVPIGICVVYIAMAFGTPSLWTRIRPESAARAPSWREFRKSGIMTEAGRCDATSATIQVLILPVMVLAWGVATALLWALLG